MKRKINIQKVFNAVSIVFLSACALYYGIRFLTLYIKNERKMSIEANTLGNKLKKENKDILKNIEGTLYFTGDVNTNYVLYSGILWRAIKIDENNTVTLVTDNAITVLAPIDTTDYNNSYITTWLNKNDNENSGILEKNISNYTSYLKVGSVCADKIDAVSNSKCTNQIEKYVFNTLTATDYVNTGAGEGFINSNENFYLSDLSNDNSIWYVNTEGKVGKSKGTDIYGVKVVIKLRENVNLADGDGTKANPYTFDTNKNYLGSYVKLGDDLWRVMDVKEDKLKLVYDKYISLNGTDVVYKFSHKSAYFDDTVYGTAAYYMNTDFLNSLSYKDRILDNDFSWGYYGSSNEYDYTDSMSKTLKTKVGLISVGDIILNHELTDYFIMNTSSIKNTFIYTYKNDNTLFTKSINSTAKLVPVITISSEKLIGEGTKQNPYSLGD